jgi:HrpA-like RNA helicase
MDALDSFEDLTELGHHLADLPVEPRLGKMVHGHAGKKYQLKNLTLTMLG